MPNAPERKDQPERWHRLDNTANLFPVIASKRFSNVYRLSINFAEVVDPELLQRALEKTLPWFSAFRVRLRRGMFWHYLETNAATPTIYEEDDYPCRYIDASQNNHFLFRVSYYDTRVNLEVFHVLTDGAGGMRFLLALCCQYLLLAHPTSFSPEEKERRWFGEWGTDTEDSYVANYTPTKKSTFRLGRAYKLKGERNLLERLSVVQAHIELPGLLAFCREKGVSITQYITACIGWAIYNQQLKAKPQKLPVNIFIPINLRTLFDSTTSLNFFSNIYISLSFDSAALTFEALLADVKRQFEEKINKDNMLEKISYTVGSGYSPFIRIVPLFLKNAALRVLYETSAKSSTLVFSNLGKVDVPAPFARHIAGAAVLLSTSPREPFKCAAASYGNAFTLSFTSILRSVSLQRDIIRHFADDGLSVTVETNGVDYASM